MRRRGVGLVLQGTHQRKGQGTGTRVTRESRDEGRVRKSQGRRGTRDKAVRDKGHGLPGHGRGGAASEQGTRDRYASHKGVKGPGTGSPRDKGRVRKSQGRRGTRDKAVRDNGHGLPGHTGRATHARIWTAGARRTRHEGYREGDTDEWRLCHAVRDDRRESGSWLSFLVPPPVAFSCPLSLASLVTCVLVPCPLCAISARTSTTSSPAARRRPAPRRRDRRRRRGRTRR